MRFLRMDVQLRYRRQREEWSLVVRCVHHPASCVCGIGVAGVWRELGLVEGLVLGMGAGRLLPKGIVKLGSLSTGDTVIQSAVHPYRSKAVPISAPTLGP